MREEGNRGGRETDRGENEGGEGVGGGERGKVDKV